MFRNRLLLIVALVLSGAISFDQARENARRQNTLESLYIARTYFSDFIPGWSEQITEVTPQGQNVRVRIIHISQANYYCSGLIVRAAEHIFPHTSIKKVAGQDLCAFTSEGVDAALRAAAPKTFGDRSDSATETIVAKCGTTEKKFYFPYPVEVDQKALERENPAVSRLWDINYRVFKRALGQTFSFSDLTPEQQRQMEDLGTKLVPELVSGKYQTAYAGGKCGDQDCDNYLAWQLKGYTAARQPYDPYVVTLLDADSLHLDKYVSPVMPQIAKTAHVYGDVRLRIFLDPATGTIRNVEAVSGPPILLRASIEAARSWQFAPRASSGEPLEATLRFELRCR